MNAVDLLPLASAIRDSVSGTDLTIDLSTNLDPGDDYVIQIEAGAITDTVGNPFAGILASDVTTWNFATAADTVNPTIIALNPADNATEVGESANLVTTFDEPIVPAAPPVLLEEDFDGVAGPGLPVGWSTAIGATAWEVGDPNGGPAGGPGAAVSGSNCAGTGITTDYTASTTYSLISPAESGFK